MKQRQEVIILRIAYPNLEAEIARKGIKKKEICEFLGISYRSWSNKMKGVTPVTWPEVCKIQSEFFPYVSKDYLFKFNI